MSATSRSRLCPLLRRSSNSSLVSSLGYLCSQYIQLTASIQIQISVNFLGAFSLDFVKLSCIYEVQPYIKKFKLCTSLHASNVVNWAEYDWKVGGIGLDWMHLMHNDLTNYRSIGANGFGKYRLVFFWMFVVVILIHPHIFTIRGMQMFTEYTHRSHMQFTFLYFKNSVRK